MMRTTTLDLDGHRGLLLRPETARWLYVLAHGAGAGMQHAFMEEISARLAAHDVATLRWEFLYMTAGKPRTDSVTDLISPCEVAYNVLRSGPPKVQLET